jgi:hypothetical protein
MKDFQKIDWKQYNRPPFYQQWLCRDDTLKLASFGDKGLSEVDGQILALKDQWDIDNIKGHFLDRIGKVLDEKRNGNTDTYYRILLKLRRLLNTNDGSIPAIIKAIKFFYSSEIVHIVPDYPAGLIIEHDGEGTPGLNFNRLLAEIIPAGVSFSTKELFYFIDELLSNDAYKTTVRYKTAESVSGQIYHNGRILRDGQTILPTEKLPYIRNGRNYHNGDTARSGEYTAEANSYIKLPLLRVSGILDPIHFGFGLDFKEFQLSRTYHNGNLRRKIRAKHNGEHIRNGATNRRLTARHDGLSMSSLEDYLAPLSFHSGSLDEINLMEGAAVTLNILDGDEMNKGYKRDGSKYHNSGIFHSGRVIDIMSLIFRQFLSDTVSGSLYRNGLIFRNGVENHSLTGAESSYEKAAVKIKNNTLESVSVGDFEMILLFDIFQEDIFSHNYSRNNTVLRDGNVYRSSIVNDKNVFKIKIEPAGETQYGLLAHNASVRRNGEEKHRSQRPAYDRLQAGMRYHRFHDGGYSRNNGIKHNAGVLIPLNIS